jgi:hypothetical protein
MPAAWTLQGERDRFDDPPVIVGYAPNAAFTNSCFSK